MRSSSEFLDLLPDGRTLHSDGTTATAGAVPLRVFRPAALAAAGRAMADAGLLTVLPDARGHGRRSIPQVASGEDLPVLDFLGILLGTVEDLRPLTDCLLGGAEVCNGTVGVRGFSMGGQIALLAAARDRRLDPVCAVGGVFPAPSDDPADYPASNPDGEELARLVQETDLTPLLHELAQRRLLVVRGRDDPHLEASVVDAFVGNLLAAQGAGSVDDVVYAGGHHPPGWADSWCGLGSCTSSIWTEASPQSVTLHLTCADSHTNMCQTAKSPT